jgi:nicotine blue oxidoreductase
VARSATEDVGARDYLRARRQDVVLVECGDIGSGEDLDTPADVAGGGLTLEP